MGTGRDEILCDECISTWIRQTANEKNVIAGIRPENFWDVYRKDKHHRDDLTEEQQLMVTITHRELLGNEVILYFDLCGTGCCMKASVENASKTGDIIPVWIDISKVCLFDKNSGKNLFYDKRNVFSKE